MNADEKERQIKTVAKILSEELGADYTKLVNVFSDEKQRTSSGTRSLPKSKRTLLPGYTPA